VDPLVLTLVDPWWTRAWRPCALAAGPRWSRDAGRPILHRNWETESAPLASRFSYTTETWAQLIGNSEDRRKAAQSYIESVAGKLHGRLDQSMSPALADIIGMRRERTAGMIFSGSMP